MVTFGFVATFAMSIKLMKIKLTIIKPNFMFTMKLSTKSCADPSKTAVRGFIYNFYQPAFFIVREVFQARVVQPCISDAILSVLLRLTHAVDNSDEFNGDVIVGGHSARGNIELGGDSNLHAIMRSADAKKAVRFGVELPLYSYTVVVNFITHEFSCITQYLVLTMTLIIYIK